MNNRAILTCFHKYQPYGGEYYEPLLDSYLTKMRQFEDEYDHIYLVDSNWNIQPDKIADMKVSIIKVNPNLRYYDAYKEVLPQIKEELILFTDNDLVICRDGIIRGAFLKLEPSLYNRDTYDVVSIYDSCGNYKTDKLNGKNKFCPYLFATRKELLMKYRDIDWGSHLPESETLGYLTKAMLDDGIKPYEFEEDKSSIYFDGTQDGEKSKDLNYYHIRAGSTPAVLLAWKDHAPDTYWSYLKNQPKREYLRQIGWFYEMSDKAKYYVSKLLMDMNITSDEWIEGYMPKFRKYHNL